MNVIRYFHIRPTEANGNHIYPKGGATVRVEGDTDGGPVRVQHTVCSYNDSFVKSVGRQFAESKRPMTIPLAQLPQYLDSVRAKVSARRPSKLKREGVSAPLHLFGFSTKYFQPKGE